jgi:hypothetical protein
LIGWAGSVLWLELGVEGGVEAGVEVMRVFLQSYASWREARILFDSIS